MRLCAYLILSVVYLVSSALVFLFVFEMAIRRRVYRKRRAIRPKRRFVRRRFKRRGARSTRFIQAKVVIRASDVNAGGTAAQGGIDLSGTQLMTAIPTFINACEMVSVRGLAVRLVPKYNVAQLGALALAPGYSPIITTPSNGQSYNASTASAHVLTAFGSRIHQMGKMISRYVVPKPVIQDPSQTTVAIGSVYQHRHKEWFPTQAVINNKVLWPGIQVYLEPNVLQPMSYACYLTVYLRGKVYAWH